MRDLSPQRKKAKTFEALIGQVARLSARLPVLMVFEDVHWLDPSSRDLLDQAIERIATWPALLVATFRPEFQPPWTGNPNVTTLALTRLDRRETASLVDGIAGGDKLPAEIVDEIVDRTDGVPLFVEEFTKAVIEALASGGTTTLLAAAPRAGTAVPATLQASLMARLDHLAQPKRWRRSAPRSAALSIMNCYRRCWDGNSLSYKRPCNGSPMRDCCSCVASRRNQRICSSTLWCKMQPTACYCAADGRNCMLASPLSLNRCSRRVSNSSLSDWLSTVLRQS